MSRRGRVAETGEEVQACCWHREAAVVVELSVPHSDMVSKNQEGYLGSEHSQPLPDHTAQGSSTKKINPYNS